jgi:hypothetical protein
MAALCSTGLAASSWRFLRVILGAEGEAMRLVTYGAVAAIALGSVLLGLDWLSAPMSPMADTEAGLRAAAPPRVAAPAPAVSPLPVAATAAHESAHRRADCFSQPGRAKERQYAGIVRRHSSGCTQRTGRRAAAGGPLQRERVCDGLSSFVPCDGLHISAEQWPAPVVREVGTETLFQ